MELSQQQAAMFIATFGALFAGICYVEAQRSLSIAIALAAIGIALIVLTAAHHLDQQS